MPFPPEPSHGSRFVAVSTAFLLMVFAARGAAQFELHPLRPPAVPLVLHDPYFSIWSPFDRLTDGETTHWTNDPDRLCGLIRVNSKVFRLIGARPDNVPAFPQTTLRVYPTRTIIEYEGEGLHLQVTFLTPALPHDLDLLATPVTTIIYEAKSLSDAAHSVEVFFGADADICGEAGDVVEATSSLDSMPHLMAGTQAQPILQQAGDWVRINWGYLVLSGPTTAAFSLAPAAQTLAQFSKDGHIPESPAKTTGTIGTADTPLLGVRVDLGQVGSTPASCHFNLGYEDIFAIEYRGVWMEGYWKRNGSSIIDALRERQKTLPTLRAACEQFDRDFVETLTKVRGAKFATLAALAHRQSLAGGKLCYDGKGKPLYFPKENTSNGCISTTDVIYPQAPHFLLFNVDLCRAALIPILDYATSASWKFPFAPHDLGTYPHANGQVYGGGEVSELNQMPVEESGNMLLLCAAVARRDGSTQFFDPWWPKLLQWAEYLAIHGIDPAHQLSTDDFTGHLARNVNLSAKTILALAAFAQMADTRGDKTLSRRFKKLADDGAAWWRKEARVDSHFKLSFGVVDSWSQKYNLIWDKVLDLGVFPKPTLDLEIKSYIGRVNPFGLPLDSRARFTKTDWCLWTAALTDDRHSFDTLVDPVFRFADESTTRVPLADWYWTNNGDALAMFARPVIGGVFMPALRDEKLWATWSGRARRIEGPWAAFPIPPRQIEVVKSSRIEPQLWRILSTSTPPETWNRVDFDDSTWRESAGGFGTKGTPGAEVRTHWDTSELYLRRWVEIPEGAGELSLLVHHDEEADIYVDGRHTRTLRGYTTSYRVFRMNSSEAAAWSPGRHLIAVRIRQTRGGQYFDLGVLRRSLPK